MVLTMERWIEKVAIVTGASSGIGAAISEALVKVGLRVVGLARRKERVEALAKNLQGEKGKLYAFCADITKEEDILKAFEWAETNVGPVNILVNNAGVLRNTSLTDGSTQLWREVLDTNLLGLCIATREAIKQMKSNSIDGHIIHINSVSGHIVPPIPNMNVYPASKFAVTALTETLRQELNSIGSRIKITSISPGAVYTEIINSPFESDGKSFLDIMMDIGGNYDVLQAKDIADAALYVLSTPSHVQVHELIIKPVGELA